MKSHLFWHLQLKKLVLQSPHHSYKQCLCCWKQSTECIKIKSIHTRKRQHGREQL